MSPTGDYVFGAGARFLVNSPEAVKQAIETRMELLVGEWFLDDREGLNTGEILGYGTTPTRDRAIQQRILGTQGARSLLQYSSSVDDRRAFRVTARVDTIYGVVEIDRTFTRSTD